MPEIDLEDVKIHYDEVGSGPFAYIHCHGLSRAGDAFLEHLPFWAEHVGRAVTWDHRGRGQSSGARKYNMHLYASDLARLMDGLGIEKAIIHGNSWGGVLLIQFALDYPEKCAAAIFDSTSSEVNVAGSENWYQIGEVIRNDYKVVQKEEVQAAYAGHTSTPAARVAESGKAEGRWPIIPPEDRESYVAMTRAIAALREHPYTPRLKHITCPALVVVGGKDSTSGAAGAVIMSRNLPNARLEIYQDAEHIIYQEKQEEFRALALEFCRDQGILKA